MARFQFIILCIIASALSCSCSKSETPVLIATVEVTGITDVSARSGGIIVYGEEGGYKDKGVVWGTVADPTIENNSGRNTHTGNNSEFSSIIEGLNPGTVYYIRAYASNILGTAYGDEQSFRTYLQGVNDIDGNTYYTIGIGSQEWMGTNLKTTRYLNGDSINFISLSQEWESVTGAARTVYNSDIENERVFGSLYNWYAVTDDRGICPPGWRVPGDEDWKVLERELGMSTSSSNRSGLRDRYAGGKLKERGTARWNGPNILATDEYGFRALPGGYIDIKGNSQTRDRNGNWWTSTELHEINAIYRNLYHENAGIYRSGIHKNSGFSVRCMKEIM
ncbi:MAG: fibrobacter succinogenes major paralogous domain-containing protein [Bacteroidales bacterium]